MGRKHYLSVVGNYAFQDDNFFDIFGRKGIWGGGVGYSRDTMLGPIDLMFSFSDWTEKLGCYFNLGFYFLILLRVGEYRFPASNVSLFSLKFDSDFNNFPTHRRCKGSNNLSRTLTCENLGDTREEHET